MVRTPRGAAHPLHHLMLVAVLDGLQAVEPDRPFGTGPWLCRNPVADHYRREAVVDVTVRRDRQALYGDFACSCGYIYTRSKAPDGNIGEPKFRRFGPSFAPALRQAVERGDSLRSTARALGIDPKTLMREAAMAGVEVPWMLKASGAVPIPSPPRAKGRKRMRGGARLRQNWFAIDTRLARSAHQTAATVVAERPPVRVTFAELERRISKRSWVAKRMAKLPQTFEALRALAEDTDAFRLRRLHWHLAEALANEDLRPCEVLRAAGLPMTWLPAVRNAITALQIRGKLAA